MISLFLSLSFGFDFLLLFHYYLSFDSSLALCRLVSFILFPFPPFLISLAMSRLFVSIGGRPTPCYPLLVYSQPYKALYLYPPVNVALISPELRRLMA
jgi:hypothetical protein